MRILVLTQYFPPETGGPQVRLEAMCQELSARGHDVEVVTALPNYPEGQIYSEYKNRFYVKESQGDIIVHRLWLHASTGAGVKRVLNYFSFATTSLVGCLKSRRPDYIFVSSPPLFLGIPAVLASKAWKTLLIFNVADLWPDSVRELGLINNSFLLRLGEVLERWVYRQSDYVCAVTEGIRTTLRQEKGVPSDKILFLPNGVDIDLFRPRASDGALAEELGTKGEWTALYAGTHGYAHGLDVALHAAKILRDEDVHFLLVGGGSDKERLVEMAGEMNLSNVTFLDSVPPEKVGRLYSIADAGLSTLRDSPLFEGTRPAKVFASMAASKPVLYSGEGEGARMVEEVGAGVVTPPEDAEALAKAVLHLRQNLEKAEEMGAKGRHFVKEHYSWEVLVEDWLKQLSDKSI